MAWELAPTEAFGWSIGRRIPSSNSPQSGRALLTLGSFGAKVGTDDTPYAFNRPAGIAFDSRGNVYVADGYKNTRVAKYSPPANTSSTGEELAMRPDSSIWCTD